MPLIIPIPFTPDPPIVRAILAVWSFLFGAVVGSFLNVCIYRVPRGISINNPKRSFCPRCNAQLTWYENLPIIGWLILRGRCGHCHKPISPRYPLVETLTAVLFVVLWYVCGGDLRAMPHLETLAAWIMAGFLIVAAFMDYDRAEIPEVVTAYALLAGLLAALVAPDFVTHQQNASLWRGLMDAILGAGGAGIIFALLATYEWYLNRPAGKSQVLVEPKVEDFVWSAETPDARGATLAFPSQTTPPIAWQEFFEYGQQFVMTCQRLLLAGKEYTNVTLRCFEHRVELNDKSYWLDEIKTFSGRANVLRPVLTPPLVGVSQAILAASIGTFLGREAGLLSAGPCLLLLAVFIVPRQMFMPMPLASERARRSNLTSALFAVLVLAWVIFKESGIVHH